MRFIKLALFFLALAGQARSANFELSASVSKDHVELGESFVLSLNLLIDGNFAFQPEIQVPSMEGFQVRGGPQQGSQVTWVNGNVKTQATVQWELVALKSGKLSLGPFKASAKDASIGELVKTAPAISVFVAKGQGFALPPTPTPEPEGAAQDTSDSELHGIKPDLGFPWARASLVAAAALLLLALILWLALRPRPVKKIEAVRDPGQVALLELEKARQLLLNGEEERYYRELARIIRFYLRHRMDMPQKELTLREAQRLLQAALLAAATPEDAAEGDAAMERLQELLFAGTPPEARDGERLAPALRSGILALEKNAAWKEEDLVKADLDRAAEAHAEDAEAWFRETHKAFKAYLLRAEERLGNSALQARLAKGLEELGPAAAARAQVIVLHKRMKEGLDLEKLTKELGRLAELIEKGDTHGKRQ